MKKCLALLVLLFMIFTACEKEENINSSLSQDSNIEGASITNNDSKTKYVNLESLKEKLSTIEVGTNSLKNDLGFVFLWDKAINKKLGFDDEYTLVPLGVANNNSRKLKIELEKYILGFYNTDQEETEYILFKKLNPRKKDFKNIDEEITNGSFHQINFNKNIDSIYLFLDSYIQEKSLPTRNMCPDCPEFGDDWWDDLWDSISSLASSIAGFFSGIFSNSVPGFLDIYIYSGPTNGQYYNNWLSLSSYISELGVGTDYYGGGGGGNHSVLVADNFGRKIYDVGLEAAFAMMPFLENVTVSEWKTLSQYPFKADICESYLKSNNYSNEAIAIVEAYLEIFEKFPEHRGSLSLLNEPANHGLLDDDVLGLSIYYPCSEIVFSSNQSPSNQRIAQFDVISYINTLLCYPSVNGSEGFIRNLKLGPKIEARLPNHLFSGNFGYQNQQTNLAEHITEAHNFAWNLVKNNISCSSAVSNRGQYRAHFMSYLNDNNVKYARWGNSAYSINFYQNYQTNIPGYSDTDLWPTFYNSTDCN